MTGLLAELRHSILSSCSISCAASACSEKTELTDWALSCRSPHRGNPVERSRFDQHERPEDEAAGAAMALVAGALR
jgi:hypothetical protein